MISRLLLVVSITFFVQGCGKSEFDGSDETRDESGGFFGNNDNDNDNDNESGIIGLGKKGGLLSIVGIGDFFKSLRDTLFGNIGSLFGDKESFLSDLNLVDTSVKSIFGSDGFELAAEYETDYSINVEGDLSIVQGDRDLGCLQVSYDGPNAIEKHMFLIVGSKSIYSDKASKRTMEMLVHLDGEWKKIPQDREGIIIADFAPGSASHYDQQLCFRLDKPSKNDDQAAGELIFQVAESSSKVAKQKR